MLYLAFVDEIGRGVNEEYLYRFDYTKNPDVVWGDYFNIVPCSIVPTLQPDKNSLSFSQKIMSKIQLNTAKKNSCFSMQDCFDGIIPLAYSEIDGSELYHDGMALHFNFGENFDSVSKKLDSFKENFTIFESHEIKTGDDSIIDNLIDSISSNDDDDENDF